MHKIKAIISDADGTLINTVYLIRHGQYEAAVAYLISRGVTRQDIPRYEVYESSINKAIGGSTRETFEKTLRLLFKDIHEHHLSKINFDELDATLGPIQDTIAPLHVHPFPGLTELFDWLGANDISLGIFSSGSPHHIVRNFGIALPVLGYTDLFRSSQSSDYEKLEAFIERIKGVYGLPRFAVVTCDDVTKNKPDPESILKVIDKLGITANEAIVLGDHAVDMLAARAAGVYAIGISRRVKITSLN